MQIKLNLVKSLIIEAVKAETYIKGEIDKSTAQGTNKLAYNEQAGDDEYHERKLVRTMDTALGELKGLLSNYLDNSGATTANNVNITEVSANDTIVLTLMVSQRFNQAYADSLAKLCAKYIEDKMLVLWWGTINQNQAAFYSNLLVSDIDSIERCFNKTAPEAPAVTTTTSVTVPTVATYGLRGGEATVPSIEMEVGSEEGITYVIDEGAIDDIDIKVDDNRIAKAYRSNNGFTVLGVAAGSTIATLYSLHDDTVKTEVYINVYK